MSSKRHTPGTLLAAARDRVLAVGVRRTTLTDVARHAGVSRMTVYRSYRDVRSMVSDVMTAEFGAVLDERRSKVEGADARARLVAQTVGAVQDLRENPLLRKVVAVDPELMLPYVTERLGETQHRAEAFFSEAISEGHEDGSIRRTDVTVQARTMLLVAQSYVLSLGPAAERVDVKELYEELRRLLDAYLTPDPP